ncbi:MAG: hypothetical protein AB7O57_18395 [Hyphomicrobiaceae bacterium]
MELVDVYRALLHNAAALRRLEWNLVGELAKARQDASKRANLLSVLQRCVRDQTSARSHLERVRTKLFAERLPPRRPLSEEMRPPTEAEIDALVASGDEPASATDEQAQQGQSPEDLQVQLYRLHEIQPLPERFQTRVPLY